jgi:hypothetical protein
MVARCRKWIEWHAGRGELTLIVQKSNWDTNCRIRRSLRLSRNVFMISSSSLHLCINRNVCSSLLSTTWMHNLIEQSRVCNYLFK